MKERVMRASRGLLLFLVSSAVGAQEERLFQLVQPAVEQRLATLAGGDARTGRETRRAPSPPARFAMEPGPSPVRLTAHDAGGPDCARLRRHHVGHPGRLS